MAETAETASYVRPPNPGEYKVIKRGGGVVEYDAAKIAAAVSKAFVAVEGTGNAAAENVRQRIKAVADAVDQRFHKTHPTGGVIGIEDIQDQVELALMRAGEHKVAKAYVIYREDRARERSAQDAAATFLRPSVSITDKSGETKPITELSLPKLVEDACCGIKDVCPEALLREATDKFYDGISESDARTQLLMSARSLVETEPNYNFVAAALVRMDLQREVCGALSTVGDDSVLLAESIRKGVDAGRLDRRLDSKLFDMRALSQAMKSERDTQFTYLGIQTLYDRYLLHEDGVRYETPQIMLMRVAMGLALEEDDPTRRAIEFYDLLSSFDYMSSTPTLFNAGTVRQQLSSCYLTSVPDDLEGIYGAIRDNALLSKWAGGLGNDWTPVRSMDSHIKGTNGKSNGVVPFLKVANDTAVAVNQGGKRRGAVCAYLETWHADIEEFLDLRKNTGDDRRRTHDMNTANWVPDLFMKRVFDQGEWTLLSPADAPDLHDLYGKDFERRYEEYEEKVRQGDMPGKTIKAADLWRKMLSMLYETGHPWITFKDPCNIRSPQQHAGVVHSSNLCTEITLNTSRDGIAVCNLGSLNLAQHMKDGRLDEEKVRRTVKTAVRMLDNVIDLNYYSVPQAMRSNLRHRPVGLGLMGFQDALHQMDVSYASDDAVDFADRSMEVISHCAIEASCDLAQERGSYPSFEGSLWSEGILPIDSMRMLKKERGTDWLEADTGAQLDWERLRRKVQEVGMRNSNVMAIAPTATIANITGVSQGIDPTFQNLYVKSNLSGEFTIVNPYMAQDLKDRGLWDQAMVSDLKYFNGSLKPIERIPEELKAKYATAFEVGPKWLVEAGSRRQKWIDQAQSMNLYVDEPSGKKLDNAYRMAWLRGLKTTYYLRTLSATNTEKSTVENRDLNAVSAQSTQGVTDADEGCEACQ